MMKTAINIAKQTKSDIPIGAVIVKNGIIVAAACNTREKENDITGHCEINAIREACQKLNNWRLDDCEIYVTLEPCPMCAWAILQARIKTVYFGSFNPSYGAFSSMLNLSEYSDFKPKIYGGIMEKECDELLETFWSKNRSSQRQ